MIIRLLRRGRKLVASQFKGNYSYSSFLSIFCFSFDFFILSVFLCLATALLSWLSAMVPCDSIERVVVLPKTFRKDSQVVALFGKIKMHGFERIGFNKLI